MNQLGLVSSYTVAQYKPFKAKCNEELVENIIDRQFNQQTHLNVVVSDLTYVRVNGRWNYICILLDLYNREIIGYSAGAHKDAKLVKQAFYNTQVDLSKINLFHTDSGNEFKNPAVDDVLNTVEI